MSLRNIGKSIRERRKELNVNQRTVADLSGVAVNTLLAVERGEGNPQLSSLIAILDTLGLQIDITVKQLNDETV
jgi:transcriptional regulator with XRE-family HTH domain